MFSFAWPWMFALLPLPLLLLKRIKQGSQQRAVLSNLSLPLLASEQHGQQQAPSQPYWPWLLWLLLCCSLARPIWLSDEVHPLNEQGRDMLIAVDMSSSMQLKDMQLDGETVDRLAVVKKVLSDFIERRRGDRIGLILFADHAYLASPLSFDLDYTQLQVDELVHGLVGDMTAIGEAIGQGVKQLLEHPAEQRVLVLLTDGQNTSGQVQPLEAAQIAAQNRVRIITVGVGADEMYQQTLFGRRKVNPSHDLDEQSLQQIAELTGGANYRARSSEELEGIYQLIDNLNPISESQQFYRPQQELYFYPLGVLLALWLGLLAWRNIAIRRLPSV